MFFDDYARFFETSEISPFRGRLNLRYEAIFSANADLFRGARVLDLASHDGRWSFAALKTGATHVTGIEARKGLVDNANETFSRYGVSPDTYRFICGDVFDVLRREDLDIDVVMCLGYLYHTYRHTEFFALIREMAPSHLIIDSHVVPRMSEPFVRLRFDHAEKQGDAVPDPYSYGGRTLVALPSVPAITMMAQAYGYGVEQLYDWQGLLAEHPDAERVGDYRDGWRVTLRCKAGAESIDVREQRAPADRLARLKAAVAPGGEGRSWRGRVNAALAAVTGYELHRAAGSMPEP